ncbi:MAG: hydrogenase formation protein HypD [Nitrospirae bacterium]|nr:MAG: hydrogenase formation protein HypD [Nitrospirota bacterium]
MKYVDEYRDARLVRTLARAIRETVQHPWTIMEICGGQTHAIVRFGLDRLLPPEISLIHGPGCPVCVTPISAIDAAIRLASLPHVTLCSFGDMLRVPGSADDLLGVKARGGDIRTMYSPLEALKLAQTMPSREIVVFAVGFETTAPAHAMLVLEAQRAGLTNLSLIVAHVRVPPAIKAILASPENRVQGFLAAGHVCTVMGYEEYEELVRTFRVPIVVTGFEPVDILEGVLMLVRQLEAGEASVHNQYARSVDRAGNRKAQHLVDTVFELGPQHWRGIGELPSSGLRLKPRFAHFDALQRFAASLHPSAATVHEKSECYSGLVLQGRLKPHECPSFAARCTPDHPLGAPMVSSEGACAAYYRYRPPTSSAARP